MKLLKISFFPYNVTNQIDVNLIDRSVRWNDFVTYIT